MALTITPTGTTVTLDETAGLQNDDTNVALPAAFSSRLTALGADPATAINAAVSNGNVISISGVTGTIDNLAFTDANGGALDGDSSGLFTNDGEEIFLFTDTVNDNIVLGKTAAGAIAFAVFLEETGSPVSGGKFWSIQYEALEHPDATNPDDSIDLGNNLKVAASEQVNFGFAGAPSGSNLFMMFGDPNSTQIVVIGKDPLNQSEGGNINTKDVLNISQAGSTTSFGVNGNQINPDEGAFITYVTGANTNFLVPNLDQNEADIEANIAFQNVVNANTASFTVNQTNPGKGPVTVKISAFSTAAEPGVNFVDGLTNDTHVNITSASVVNFVVNGEAATPVATVNADGTLTVTGLTTGDRVTWTTSGTHDRVLIENISNADGVSGNDNNTFDIGGFSISKTNAASAVVGTAVHFEDDGPTAGIVQGAATVAHDETAGVQADANDTAAAAVAALFAGVANPSLDLSPTGFAQNPTAVVSSTGSSFGTDSVGGTMAFSLAVSAAGVDSGLDTTDGTSIFLFKEGDLVVGRIGSAAGAAAFAVAIDSLSGVVSVAQYASLKHPDGTNPDDSVSITDSALLAVVTVTDGDGDKATSSTGIGDAVQFQDDGPTAAIVQGAATVAHDETAGIQADADDTTAAGVVALFAGVSNVSTDLNPTGFAQDATPVVSSTGSSFGADQEGGTTAFSLAVSAAGVDSGLDTTDGTSILLFKEGDLVVGRIGSAAGAAAFAVAIDSLSGVVSVAQYASLKHPDATNPDDSVSITDSALLAVVTVTDGDGDKATSSTGIGDAVQFQDDGPTAAIVQGAATVAHDETAGIQADADDTTAAGVVALFAGVSNVSTDLNPTGFAQDATPVVSSTGSSFGADQEGGTTAFSLAVSAAGVDSGLDTTDGTSILLFKEGDLVVGRIGSAAGAAAFAVAIDSLSGVVSVAQYASLKHPDGTNPDDSVSITDSALLAVVTVTDGDGDKATSSTGIGDAVQFQDDGPTAAIVQGAATVAHDETAGIQADADDTTAAGVVALFAGVSNVSTDLNPTGFAQDATPVVSSTGSSFGADQEGGTTAFSLAVSAAGVDSGLDTTDGTSILLFKEGDLVVGRIGSAAGAAAFAVAIDSLSGVVSVAQYASLKHPDATNPDDSVSITDSALLAVVTVTDGDGDKATSSTGIGDAVQFQDDGPTAAIVQGAATVAHDETAGIQADADDTTAAGVVALFAGVSNVSTDLNPTGFAQDATPVVSSTGSSFGADQEGGTTAFSLAVSAAGVDSGLDTTDGTSILLFKEGDLVVGRIGSAAGAAAFAVAIDSLSGVVSVAQYASLKHPDATNPDDSVSITDSALLAVVTVTDGDGDKATSSTGIGDAVQFQDDGPTAAIVQGAATVAHDETAGIQADADDTTAAGVVALFAGVSNVSTDLNPTGFAQDATPVVSSTGSSFGADQEGGTTAFSLAVSAAGVDSGLDTTDGTSILLFKEGDLVVGRIGSAAGAAAFAVAIDSLSGVVSVAQYASLKHPDGTNPDDSVSITDSALLAVVTVTDGDGDKATSSTGIGDAVQFQDDGPTAAIVQGAATVAHDETAGIQADADDTTAAGVVALFAGVSNVSTDLNPTGFAQDATPVVSSTGSSFGADQEGGTTAFSLAVSAAGVDSGLDTTDGTSILLFKEGDLVVGRIGSAAGAAAFAVAIDSLSGVVSVAQYASLKHPDATNPDDSVSITDSALLAVVTVTDGDGDKATSSTGIGDAVQFQDDGPTAAIVQGAATVAHDETAGIQADADDTTAAGVVALFAGVSNVSTDLNPTGFAQDATPVVSSTGSSFGADQEGGTTAFSLAVSAAGVDSGLDTTDGTSILLFKEGDLVVGRIGSAAGAAAFAVAIDSLSGVVSMAQYASLKHPDATNPDDSVSITDSALLAVVTVTDGDGDKATSSTGIGDAVQFQDDGPAIGPISDGLVDFTTISGPNPDDFGGTSTSSVTNPLNGTVGADDPATYSVTSSPATLTIFDGTNAQLTLLRDITNSGTVVTYFKDDGDGIHDAGDIDFFKLTLSGGNYTFDVLTNAPPAELEFQFTGAPSGDNLFMTFGDPNTVQIVVIGEDPLNQSQGGNINTKDVVQISSAQGHTSFGVNGNQINPDEGAFITYVTGANTNFLVPNLDQNEADVEANIAFTGVFNATKASFDINQTNPGVGPVTVKISAFTTAAEPGVNFVDGLTNDTHVNITSLSVVDNVVIAGNKQFFPVATNNGDGTWTVTGLSTGDELQWTTSGTHDRVLIQNISNADGIAGNDNNTFDIGGFKLLQAQPAPDEKLDFTVQIADADGDTANSSFSIGIDGTGINDNDHVVGVNA